MFSLPWLRRHQVTQTLNAWLSSRRLTVLGFTLRAKIHLEFFLLYMAKVIDVISCFTWPSGYANSVCWSCHSVAFVSLSKCLLSLQTCLWDLSACVLCVVCEGRSRVVGVLLYSSLPYCFETRSLTKLWSLLALTSSVTNKLLGFLACLHFLILLGLWAHTAIPSSFFF